MLRAKQQTTRASPGLGCCGSNTKQGERTFINAIQTVVVKGIYNENNEKEANFSKISAKD